ncbi:hypothetical protein [Streptomyces sp. NPDC008141]|uniref:hypothetical protein n=1 Tax=Streptomyces sp. NPDC008141 TaxID=3364815 RepID=UPI0036E89EC7
MTTYGWDGRINPTSAKLPTGATSSLTGYQTESGPDLPGSMTAPTARRPTDDDAGCAVRRAQCSR